MLLFQEWSFPFRDRDLFVEILLDKLDDNGVDLRNVVSRSRDRLELHDQLDRLARIWDLMWTGWK